MRSAELSPKFSNFQNPRKFFTFQPPSRPTGGPSSAAHQSPRNKKKLGTRDFLFVATLYADITKQQSTYKVPETRKVGIGIKILCPSPDPYRHQMMLLPTTLQAPSVEKREGRQPSLSSQATTNVPSCLGIAGMIALPRVKVRDSCTLIWYVPEKSEPQHSV